MRTLFPALLLLLAAGTPAHAVQYSFDGYADLRLIMPSKEGSYYYGDLGKLRFGYDDGRTAAKLTDVVGEGRVLIVPGLSAEATARISPEYGPAVDLIDAFVRYRPVSTGEWRWSVKAGAFFPPVSLENDQIGWTSAWTITPSAINTWVGYELRTIGAEGTLEWRGEDGPVTLSGALFGWNDPAGALMADRGWSLDDRVSGLFEHERLPDAIAVARHLTPPLYMEVFREIDNRPGWYLNATWAPIGVGGFSLMRYDNDADPSASGGGEFAWHTSFWNAGYRGQFDDLTILAQAMTGSTEVRPLANRRSATNFASAYLLAGYQLNDDWRLAARADAFRTHTIASTPSLQDEDGQALTLDATWWAASWLQLTGEFIGEQSVRPQRALTGDAPKAGETESQILARLYF